MKKLALAVLLALCLTGCTKPESIYITHGYYYASGEVITDDGNIWGYTSDTIYHDCEVYVVFHTNDTESIYDDSIIDIVQGDDVK